MKRSDPRVALSARNAYALQQANANLVIASVEAHKVADDAIGRLHHLAYHVPLTDLPNRALLWDRLGQEIELAQRYMAIEQIRFGERLQVQWNLDPEANPAKLPPLLLQPLVENAVRHGVEPSAVGAQVKISAVRRGSMVVIKVTNSTPAGVGERGHGLALANVRERLALLHDVQAQFKTVFRDGMFQVRLEIPL